MNADTSSVPGPDRFRFEALRSYEWEWLLDLRRRLKVAVQLVDTHLEPVLPYTEGPSALALERAIASKAPALRAALGHVMQSRTPRMVAVERLQIHSVPLTVGERVVGTLVAATEEPSGVESVERSRRELDLIATALSSAAVAHMAGPQSARADQIDRISAFSRLLSESPRVGTDRDLIRTCAEAFAVWHGIDLRAYVEVADGSAVFDVSLPGVAMTGVPTRVPPEAGPFGERVEVLTYADKDRLELTTPLDAAVVKLGQGRGSWLLLLTGAIDARMQLQLNVYVQILTERLASATFGAQSRLILAMSAQLAGLVDRSEEAVRSVLTALERALGVRATFEGPAPVEATPLPHDGAQPAVDSAANDVLRLVKEGEGGQAISLVLTKADGRPHSAFDRDVAESAADVLAAWRRGGLSKWYMTERRVSARSVEGLMDQRAGQAMERGVNVSVLVFAAPQETFSRSVARRCVSAVRGDTRASDIAGMVGDGELGLLISDATPQQAETVEGRVRQTLAQVDPRVAAALVVGRAARLAGRPAPETLVQEARAAAIRARDHRPPHFDSSEQR